MYFYIVLDNMKTENVVLGSFFRYAVLSTPAE